VTPRLLKRIRSFQRSRLRRPAGAVQRWLKVLGPAAAIGLTAAVMRRYGYLPVLYERPVGELVAGIVVALLVLLAYELRWRRLQRERQYADAARELSWLRLALVSCSARVETAIYEASERGSASSIKPAVSSRPERDGLRWPAPSASSRPSIASQPDPRIAVPSAAPVEPLVRQPGSFEAGSATGAHTGPRQLAGAEATRPTTDAAAEDVDDLEDDTITWMRTMVSPGQQRASGPGNDRPCG
jgi:hypothetical protein